MSDNKTDWLGFDWFECPDCAKFLEVKLKAGTIATCKECGTKCRLNEFNGDFMLDET